MAFVYLLLLYQVRFDCLFVVWCVFFKRKHSFEGFTGEPPHWWGLAMSLLLIAIGTGGIKPVISSFLGDQFTANQERLITKIFMYFYMGINLGSVFSTVTETNKRMFASISIFFKKK